MRAMVAAGMSILIFCQSKKTPWSHDGGRGVLTGIKTARHLLTNGGEAIIDVDDLAADAGGQGRRHEDRHAADLF